MEHHHLLYYLSLMRFLPSAGMLGPWLGSGDLI
jgi:hypothetical protein